MDKLLIRGGNPLQGEVLISGAKNAALPELCATLLSAEPVTLRNVPRLQDVSTMLKLIRNMGVQVEQGADGSVRVDAGSLSSPEAPYELVKTMQQPVRNLDLIQRKRIGGRNVRRNDLLYQKRTKQIEPEIRLTKSIVQF